MHGNGVFLSWDWDLACMAGGLAAAWQIRVTPCMEGGEFRVSRCGVRIRSVEGVAGNGKRAMKHRDGVLQCLYVAGSCSMCVPCELLCILPAC